MEERLNYVKAAPNGYRAMAALNRYVEDCGLEPLLLELVKMRASQINGCAYCLDMHSKDARALGESEQRLYALNAWRETPFYTERERAALLWTEQLTLISQEHAPDAVYARVREHFSEEELVNLTLAIVTINGWNRLAIGSRSQPGIYQSTKKPLALQPADRKNNLEAFSAGSVNTAEVAETTS
jgi:AhpD family alkylhydroperoxidase